MKKSLRHLPLPPVLCLSGITEGKEEPVNHKKTQLLVMKYYLIIL